MYYGKVQAFFHHPLLHQPPQPSSQPAVDAPPGRNFSGVVSECEENGVALPVVTASMGNQDNEVKGLVMLDSGATVSLTRESVAEQLNLTSKPISIDIGTLGGAIQAYQTRMYKLRVWTDQGGCTLSAIGVAEITEVPPVGNNIIQRWRVL